MKASEELFELAKRLEGAAETGRATNIEQPLAALQDAPNQVKRSFSGSWLGYHSRVYYEDFLPAPPGANFSQEWGLKDMDFMSLGSRGEWREYDYGDVETYILRLAKNPDLSSARDASQAADQIFDDGKSEIISILETEMAGKLDAFLSKLKPT